MKKCWLLLGIALCVALATSKDHISLITIGQSGSRGDNSSVYLCLKRNKGTLTIKKCVQQGDPLSAVNNEIVLSACDAPLAKKKLTKKIQNKEKPPSSGKYILMVPRSTRKPKSSYMYFHGNKSCIKSKTKFRKIIQVKFSHSRKSVITLVENNLHINGQRVMDEFKKVSGFGIDERSEQIFLCVLNSAGRPCLAVLSSTNTFRILICFSKKIKMCKEISLDQENKFIYFITDTAIYSITYQGKHLNILEKRDYVKCLTFQQESERLYYAALQSVFKASVNPFERLKKYHNQREIGSFLVFDNYLLMTIMRQNKIILVDTDRLREKETVKVSTGPLVYLLVAVEW